MRDKENKLLRNELPTTPSMICYIYEVVGVCEEFHPQKFRLNSSICTHVHIYVGHIQNRKVGDSVFVVHGRVNNAMYIV